MGYTQMTSANQICSLKSFAILLTLIILPQQANPQLPKATRSIQSFPHNLNSTIHRCCTNTSLGSRRGRREFSRLLGKNYAASSTVSVASKGKPTCQANQCKNNGECKVSKDAPGGVECRCPKGFYGLLCEVVTPECESSPCMNQGLCVVTNDGYKCVCISGIKGDRCQYAGNIGGAPIAKSTVAVTLIGIGIVLMTLLGILCCAIERERLLIKQEYAEAYELGLQPRRTDAYSLALVVIKKYATICLSYCKRKKDHEQLNIKSLSYSDDEHQALLRPRHPVFPLRWPIWDGGNPLHSAPQSPNISPESSPRNGSPKEFPLISPRENIPMMPLQTNHGEPRFGQPHPHIFMGDPRMRWWHMGPSVPNAYSQRSTRAIHPGMNVRGHHPRWFAAPAAGRPRGPIGWPARGPDLRFPQGFDSKIHWGGGHPGQFTFGPHPVAMRGPQPIVVVGGSVMSENTLKDKSASHKGPREKDDETKDED